MQKSNELEDLQELPRVDYSKPPEVIAEAIAENQYIIKEKAKLTCDGKQFIVRIPSEIAKEMGITKENKVLFVLTKPFHDSSDKPKLEIGLI